MLKIKNWVPFQLNPSVCDLKTIFEIVEAGNDYPMAEAAFPVVEAAFPVAEATFPVAEVVPELVEGFSKPRKYYPRITPIKHVLRNYLKNLSASLIPILIQFPAGRGTFLLILKIPSLQI